MVLENKLGLTSYADFAREMERISKKKAVELFENGVLDSLEAGTLASLKAVLTDDIHSREVYMKGIDHSYYYEGYTTFKTEDLR